MSGIPSSLIPALAGLLLTLASPAALSQRASSPEQSLSLGQAIDLGLRQSWDVRIARTEVREAKIQQSSNMHLWFPRLKVTGNLLLWNKALPFEIPPMDFSGLTMPPGCELFGSYSHCFGAFLEAFDLGVIRERFTAQATVQLVQPLTPLYSVYQLGRVGRLGERMAQAKQVQTESQVRYEVTEAYLQAYQARVFDGIMKEAEELVRAHEERVAKLLQEEMVRRAEQLKVQVKLAEVRQNRLKTAAAVELSLANLARVLSLPIHTPLALTERFPDPPPPYAHSLDGCIERALRNRQELLMVKLGQEQARAGRAAARWQLVPTVAAVAQFEANHGMGTIMPKTAFFVGGVLEWEFQWGKKWKDADLLTLKLRRAELLERKAREGIPLEVKKHYLDLGVARASLGVARAAVKSAEEALRIQVKRFELQAGSNTEVLDAQMELTKSRASYSSALYQYYIAEAALERAMGGSR